MDEQRSLFIVLEGIAGSGKSTIIQAFKTWMASQQYTCFDLAEWSDRHFDSPTENDVVDADVLFTMEPSKQWIGRAIRKELSRPEQMYTGIDTAQAFALDRMIQYKRFILPSLAKGKIVIQDRSVASSAVYQPAIDSSITREEVLQLPGNAFALQHPPQHLILTKVDIDHLVARLKRNDDHKGIFENVDLLTRVQDAYFSDWFRSVFEKAGTTIHVIDANQPKDIMIQEALALLTSLITSSSYAK